MNGKKLCIRVSDIPALLNQDIYKTKDEMIDEIIQRMKNKYSPHNNLYKISRRNNSNVIINDNDIKYLLREINRYEHADKYVFHTNSFLYLSQSKNDVCNKLFYNMLRRKTVF